eukprot:TRINITY_DN1263_c0_g3_i4.p1 TRINITY_DN1263_c0_g3~~TRINITY_DN1263_c0_g3_i4.p1  ORF type:complete len:616 (-),score=126.34 TRINITY_DN1263_c0_g3_i4:61-1908(-)
MLAEPFSFHLGKELTYGTDEVKFFKVHIKSADSADREVEAIAKQIRLGEKTDNETSVKVFNLTGLPTFLLNRVLTTYEKDGFAYYILERGGVNLEEYQQMFGNLDKQSLIDFALDSQEILEVLQKANYTHNDINPSNFVLRYGNWTLIDHEEATIMDSEASKNFLREGLGGKLLTMSPIRLKFKEEANNKEFLRDKLNYFITPDSDYWSALVTLYVAANGKYPFLLRRMEDLTTLSARQVYDAISGSIYLYRNLGPVIGEAFQRLEGLVKYKSDHGDFNDPQKLIEERIKEQLTLEEMQASLNRSYEALWKETKSEANRRFLFINQVRIIDNWSQFVRRRVAFSKIIAQKEVESLVTSAKHLLEESRKRSLVTKDDRLNTYFDEEPALEGDFNVFQVRNMAYFFVFVASQVHQLLSDESIRNTQSHLGEEGKKVLNQTYFWLVSRAGSIIHGLSNALQGDDEGRLGLSKLYWEQHTNRRLLLSQLISAETILFDDLKFNSADEVKDGEYKPAKAIAFLTRRALDIKDVGEGIISKSGLIQIAAYLKEAALFPEKLNLRVDIHLQHRAESLGPGKSFEGVRTLVGYATLHSTRFHESMEFLLKQVLAYIYDNDEEF